MRYECFKITPEYRNTTEDPDKPKKPKPVGTLKQAGPEQAGIPQNTKIMTIKKKIE